MAHCKRRIPWDVDLGPSGFGCRPSHPGRQVSVQMPLRDSWTTVRLTSLGYDEPSLHDLLKACEDRHPEGEMFRSHRAGPKHLPRFVACQAPCKGQLPLAGVQKQAARPQSRTTPSWSAAFGCLHILAVYGRRSWLYPTSRLSPRKLTDVVTHEVCLPLHGISGRKKLAQGSLPIWLHRICGQIHKLHNISGLNSFAGFRDGSGATGRRMKGTWSWERRTWVHRCAALVRSSAPMHPRCRSWKSVPGQIRVVPGYGEDAKHYLATASPSFKD